MILLTFIFCARLIRGAAALYRQRASKPADGPAKNAPVIIGGLVLLALLLPSWSAQAQEYPTKSTTMIARPIRPAGAPIFAGARLPNS
jgi:hypothetical protein